MRKLIGSMGLALALLLGALAASAQTPAPHIGDVWYGGTTFKKASECTTVDGVLGVVFWVNPSDPQHGLVVALKTSAYTQWSTIEDDVTGIKNISVPQDALLDYDGSAHTVVLRALPAGEYPAAQSILAAGWTADWYLPALGELRMLYAQYSLVQPSLKKLAGLDAAKVDVMNNVGYWSSTELFASGAWLVEFSGRTSNTSAKNNTRGCRPVRKF